MVAGALLAACVTAAPEPPQKQILQYPPAPDQARYYYETTLYGSLSVKEETSADRLKRFATGESERGEGLIKPFGIAASNGRIFVGDTVARNVAVFDFPGKRYYTIGTRGEGRLVKPLGLATDKAGHVYVVDGTAKRVLVYDHEGNFKLAVGGSGLLERPSGVAANADGSRIYVVDTGGVRSQEHRVLVFDGSGKHLFDIGSRGSEDGQFNLPKLAAVGPKGELYVTDTGNFRVQVFSPDGKFLRKWGQAGRVVGHFAHPKGIAVDDEGKVFVVDTTFGNFQIFDEQGQTLMYIGERNERGDGGQYLLPSDVAVDVDGRVYVVDQFFRKVDVYRPAGLPEGAPVGLAPADEPTSLVSDTNKGGTQG